MSDLSQQKKFYRISDSEYDLICQILNRPPAGIEWALFSALWSEHCSYKSSRRHLKKFAQTLNSRVRNAAGENAGVVDLGEGERICFKMESHNHPSFIEPYQGAATGVGGILRDIFTMGARPIALADYLCFGEEGSPRREELMDGVVRGVGGYGNCVGVPTVTGSTEFDVSYTKNNLVNAMAIGYLGKMDQVALSAAQGPGNLVMYVGAKTGKDGVHGAAMASEAFGQNMEAKKPNVQIGDPFYEKLLIESCLEVLQKGLVVAIQDMGAAGLTSSSFEMSAKGEVGMDMDLSLVPLRDQSMSPEEIMLSESQERMLMVVKEEKEAEIQEVFRRWGLEAVSIGRITKEIRVRLFWHGEKICDLDPRLLVDRSPEYDRAYAAWSSPRRVEKLAKAAPTENWKKRLLQYFASDLGASKKSIYSQYDNRVGLRTARGCDSTVAFVQLPESQRGLAVAVGCKPQLMKMDAVVGAFDAVFEPALRMAAKGAKLVALTDCLNFGNPEKPEIMSEFVASVDTLRKVSLSLDAPVISGNVSFYNETLGVNIVSTPAIGAIGLRASVEKIPADGLCAKGNILFGLQREFVVCSSRNSASPLSFQGGFENAEVESKNYLHLIEGLAKDPVVLSSRVVGRGGWLVALARHALAGQALLGLELDEKALGEDPMQEMLYQVIFEVEGHHEAHFAKLVNLALKEDPKLRLVKLGQVAAGPELQMGGVKVSLQELNETYGAKKFW